MFLRVGVVGGGARLSRERLSYGLGMWLRTVACAQARIEADDGSAADEEQR